MKNSAKILHLNPHQFNHDDGYSYIADISALINEIRDGGRQPDYVCILFENELEIGPRNTQHVDIRKYGGGRYSFLNNNLWFSASDNSDPIHNNKKYSVLISAPEHIDIIDNDGLGFENTEIQQRFNCAKNSFKKIWPFTVLPDVNRKIDTDDDFKQIFQLVSPDSDSTYERKYSLNELFKLVKNVPGDVSECGVYKGGSAFLLARHISDSGLDKRLCLFDSFNGLSTPDVLDGSWWHKGDLQSTVVDVTENLKPIGDYSFIDIYEGWIPDRFDEVEDRTFCFVHIDVDLAQPTLSAVEFFYPKLSQGGIMLMDDYGFTSCPGVTKVFDDFMADKPEQIINLSSGGCFIVKKICAKNYGFFPK